MNETLASRLLQLRAMRGYTQDSLAEKTGFKSSAISRWETGGRSPSIKNIERLADALQCTTDELIRGPISRRDPWAYAFGKEAERDAAHCFLHNTGAQLSGNTQGTDVEWFGRWLYNSSNFGGGSVETMRWSISNFEFRDLGLLPDRPWTGKRWETLTPEESEAWKKLARLCLYALPHIAERIGHRFMAQAKAMNILEDMKAYG